ncbi:MAG: hypothetical protein IKR95_04925 [Oscillospiraceae bacterium]|nr:hypothetical protein [Oscillospiraceae bacterium]
MKDRDRQIKRDRERRMMTNNTVEMESNFRITTNYSPYGEICCYAEENDISMLGQDRPRVRVYVRGFPIGCDFTDVRSAVDAAAIQMRAMAEGMAKQYRTDALPA